MKKVLFLGIIMIPLIAVYFVFAQETQYTYLENIKPVLTASCGTCHVWHERYTNLVGPKSEYAPTMGLSIVYPTKPDSSVFIWRLEGKTPNGSLLEQMPKLANALPTSTIKIVRDWIAQGALNKKPITVKTSRWGAVKKLFR